MNMWGKLTSGVIALGCMGVLGVGVAAAYTAGQARQAPVETAPAADLTYLTEIGYVNGLASEQEAEAAAAEQARVAAEVAEAARVAAEQAAEAERVAAEQTTTVEEPPAEEPRESGGGIPATWIDLGNGTGMWDFSNCPTQSGSTGPDGNVYCS